MIAPIIDKLEKVAVRGGDKKLKPEYVRGYMDTHVFVLLKKEIGVTFNLNCFCFRISC